jgi:WD40 repeat protein
VEWEIPWSQPQAEREIEFGEAITSLRFTGGWIWARTYAERLERVSWQDASVGATPQTVYVGDDLEDFDARDSLDHVVLGDRHNLYVFDAASGDLRQTHPVADGVGYLSLSHNGRYTAVGVRSGKQVILLDTLTGKVQRTWPTVAPTQMVRCSPSEPLLVYSTDSKTLKACDFHGRDRWEIRLNGDVNRIEFSRDGALVCAATNDRVLHIWRAADGALVRDVHGSRGKVTSFDLAPDGRTLAALDKSNSLTLWHVSTGLRLLQVSTSQAGAGSFRECGYSPNGEWLAFSQRGRVIRMLQMKAPHSSGP